MRWLIPTSFDERLLAALAPWADRITLYGKAPIDPVGGGRTALFLPDPGDEALRDHIRRARSLGFRFNYLLNAACTGGLENRGDGRRELRQRLEWLGETGIDEITVANSSLLAIVREVLPGLRLNVGFAAGINNLRRVQAWREAGADAVTLAVELNRDFSRLRRIITEGGLPVTLLASLSCLPSCHRAPSCMNSLAHLSDRNGLQDPYSVSLPLYQCTHEKLADPWKLLAAPFIRPEDLEHYRELGVAELKLTDRFSTTEELLTRFQAWDRGRYDGNLLDLLSFGLVKGGAFRRGRRHLPRGRIAGLLAVEKRLKLSDFPEIYIDNRALDGFLDAWRDGRVDCRETDCRACTHCREWARRAIHIAGDVEAALTRFAAFCQEFCRLQELE